MEYLGEGDEGCIYKGKIPSYIENLEGLNVERSENNVIKVVFNKSIYDKTVSISKKLFKIDPKQEYYIYPHSWCEVTLADELKYDEIKENLKECKISNDMDSGAKKIYLLEMNNGGTSLDKIEDDYYIEDVSKQIYIDIYNAIYKLHELKLGHNDLLAKNIVIDSKFKTRLIDFDKLELDDIERTDELRDFSNYVLNDIIRITKDSELKTRLRFIKEKFKRMKTNLNLHILSIENIYGEELPKRFSYTSPTKYKTVSPLKEAPQMQRGKKPKMRGNLNFEESPPKTKLRSSSEISPTKVIFRGFDSP
jgi:tRNA A-37 threonylcarbamoyl transferase component Bud32